ncbi:hypothetical protein PBI_DEWDROP_30 [Microbacterium phage Dewdrop]|nr:hypothetical protein PBI_LEAF_30 [Microbacterium phage Leaf]QGZ17399.1 hypothetical protein PBI_DEWDROP_30 [Microbacterium phage Dewdrop]
MTNSYYDQRPDEPYGDCLTCGITLQTKEDAKAHRDETFGPSGAELSSHRTRAKNPTREENVDRGVWRHVNDAIDGLMERLAQEVMRDRLTKEEIRKALSFPGVELVEAWDEWIAEEDDDEDDEQ